MVDATAINPFYFNRNRKSRLRRSCSRSNVALTFVTTWRHEQAPRPGLIHPTQATRVRKNGKALQETILACAASIVSPIEAAAYNALQTSTSAVT